MNGSDFETRLFLVEPGLLDDKLTIRKELETHHLWMADSSLSMAVKDGIPVQLGEMKQVSSTHMTHE